MAIENAAEEEIIATPETHVSEVVEGPVVAFDPQVPQALQNVCVLYNPSKTNLHDANEIFIIGGWNGWTHEEKLGPAKMSPSESYPGYVSLSLMVPEDVQMFDFVFASASDESAIYDNNNDLDYHIAVEGGILVVGKPPLEATAVKTKAEDEEPPKGEELVPG